MDHPVHVYVPRCALNTHMNSATLISIKEYLAIWIERYPKLCDRQMGQSSGLMQVTSQIQQLNDGEKIITFCLSADAKL